MEPHGQDILLHVLLAMIVIIVAARAMGFVFRRIGQPPVVGEVVAGILLGPTLLGRVAPDLSAFLLPPQVAPLLGVIAQVGVILYMFLVGLDFNPIQLRGTARRVLAISTASVAVPFVMGAALAVFLYPRLAGGEVSSAAFALFLGVSMSVTAFPVLARILADRGMQASALGVLALTCAAVNDVAAWCLLAFLVGVVHARGEAVLATVAMTATFIAFVFLVLRPVLVAAARRIERMSGRTPADTVAFVSVLLMASALATEWIGIHALFGAFLLGVVIPWESRLARDLAERLEDLVVVLLLPAFFVSSGLRTDLRLLSGAERWLFCGLITAVACAGKFGGTAAAARLTGLAWRDAAALGALMNTRGLVELIVLNIGLELGVITPTVFAMLVIMALATTFATGPVLDRIMGRGADGAPTPTAGAD